MVVCMDHSMFHITQDGITMGGISRAIYELIVADTVAEPSEGMVRFCNGSILNIMSYVVTKPISCKSPSILTEAI